MKLTVLILITFLFAFLTRNSRFELPYKIDDFIQVQYEFGRKFYPILGPSKFYNGAVIQLKDEAKVFSIHGGTIISSCETCSRVRGKEITIKHGSSTIVNYYHLSEINSDLGDVVTKGQLIGVSGSTGLTTVNGLGISVKINDNIVNPKEILQLDTTLD